MLELRDEAEYAPRHTQRRGVGGRGGIGRVLESIDRGYEGMRGFYRELNKLLGNKTDV